MNKIIGILALQGDFEKHKTHIERCGAETLLVRTMEELDKINGLIIPGGESTAIGKLMNRFNLIKPIFDKIKEGLPVFGTCAGSILLSKKIIGSEQYKINVMDISVERNAYGRQVDSFETDILFPEVCDEAIRCVFIRAPAIKSIDSDEVKVLGEYEGSPVLVRQGNMLAGTFHPELTEKTCVHEYFLNML